MEEENKKPENVPINPDIVVKGRVSIKEAKEQEERKKKRLEELMATGMTREEAKLKWRRERIEASGKFTSVYEDYYHLEDWDFTDPRSKPLIYKSGSGCMVTLLIIIAPTILLSLLIFA